MKSSLRLGLLVGVLAAVLLALAGVAAHSLFQLGSEALAITVAVAGVAAALAIALAWSLASEAEQQLGDLLPALPPEPASVVAPARTGFRVREALPGEVPSAYLAAVMKGAQARQAAWRAGAGQ
jgi:hypothetical protein